MSTQLPALQCPVLQCKNEADWKEARRIILGASESAGLLDNGTEFTSPTSIWLSKKGIDEKVDEDWQTEMDYRRDMEYPIARDYARQNPERQVIDPGDWTIYRHPKFPFLGATPDRFVIDPKLGPGLLEIKTVNMNAMNKWDLGVPFYIKVQAQHQMMVTGLQWCDVRVDLALSERRTYFIRRHNPFIKTLFAVCNAFWHDNVVADKEPDIDGHAATIAAIAARYKGTDDKKAVIGMNDRAVIVAREYMRMDAELDRITQLRDLAKNALKVYIGDNYGCVYEDDKERIKASAPQVNREAKMTVGIEYAEKLKEAGIPFKITAAGQHRTWKFTHTLKDEAKPKKLKKGAIANVE